MAVTQAWTEPSTLDLSNGDVVGETQYDAILSDLLWLGRVPEPSLTNKSGGSLAAGDVVIPDTSTASSVTTTTTAGHKGPVGVAMATILNNAAGRIAYMGVVSVKVTGAVALGDFLQTSTSAGSAVSAGTEKTANTFARALSASSGGYCTALILPSANSGGAQIVSEVTASASATVSFTDLSSSYRYYEVVLRDVVPATDAVSLYLLMSTNNGSSYLSSGYQYHTTNLPANVATYASDNSNSAAQIVCNASQAGNASDESINGFFRIWNVTGSRKKGCTWHLQVVDDGGVFRQHTGAGGNNTTSAVNAIRFQMESGNITSGTFTLYGIP